MSFSKFLLLAWVTLLLGCAAQRTDPTQYDTALAFSKAMKIDTTVALLKSVIAVGSLIEPVEKAASWNTWKTQWCAGSTEEFPGYKVVQSRYLDYCHSRGGKYINNACKLDPKADGVLFYAKAEFVAYCPQPRPYMGVQVTMIEPTVSPDDHDYLKELYRVGYRNSRELAQERQQSQVQQRRADQAVVQDSYLQRMELPAKRQRGATVCRVDGIKTYKGFVEDFTDEKLKINVTFAYFTNTPSLSPGGFQPLTVWDYPENWRLC